LKRKSDLQNQDIRPVQVVSLNNTHTHTHTKKLFWRKSLNTCSKVTEVLGVCYAIYCTWMQSYSQSAFSMLLYALAILGSE